jgi:phosphatidylinositol 4-kinase
LEKGDAGQEEVSSPSGNQLPIDMQPQAETSQAGSEKSLQDLKDDFEDTIDAVRTRTRPVPLADTRSLLERASSVLLSSTVLDRDLLHYIVALPMAMFTPLAISAGVETWTKVLKQRVDAEVTIFGEITAGWLDTIRRNKGLFSTSMK